MNYDVPVITITAASSVGLGQAGATTVGGKGHDVVTVRASAKRVTTSAVVAIDVGAVFGGAAYQAHIINPGHAAGLPVIAGYYGGSWGDPIAHALRGGGWIGGGPINHGLFRAEVIRP